MPKISYKGNAMPESPIRKLVPYAEIAKKKGHKVKYQCQNTPNDNLQNRRKKEQEKKEEEEAKTGQTSK